MKPTPLLAAIAIALAGRALAAPTEAWRPVSTTAVSITGPVVLWSDRLHAGGANFTLRQVAQPASFKTDQGDNPARVFLVIKPKNPTLLNGNRFCGQKAPTWIVAQPIGQDRLQLIVFSGPDRPAGQDSPGLCGTFFYNR